MFLTFFGKLSICRLGKYNYFVIGNNKVNVNLNLKKMCKLSVDKRKTRAVLNGFPKCQTVQIFPEKFEQNLKLMSKKITGFIF